MTERLDNRTSERMTPVLRVPALVPFLRCPDQRCRKPFINVESEERFRGTLTCIRKSCLQRWFAEPLNAGSVRYQLETSFGDPNIVNDLMMRLRLPETIDAPMYLQMPIGGQLWADYVTDRDVRPRNRTVRLVRKITDLLHR